ncbi:MAG: NUDIX hydrolase [Pseudomonadota bacterium]
MHRAGAIPFRFTGSKFTSVEVLLITSMTRKRWILPKGMVEADEPHTKTAIREALEEAGVKGKLITDFPMTVLIERQFEDGFEHVPVTFFPMLAKSTSKKWQEMGARERRWAGLREARQLVAEDDYAELLLQFETLLPAIVERA